MNKEYMSFFEKIRGKTIAIVYIFEGENAPGFKHYWIWKSDIITGWMNAVQELECLPFILDVRTFIQKAINQTLPHIDFVLNLNCGSYDLSSMSLVPSMCSFLSIPCIPCDACSILTSENKRISNLIAMAKGITVPPILTEPNKNGIYRPLNLGNSIGVEYGPCLSKDKKYGTYQEFIPGYDITIPIVFNPIIQDIDLFPATVYVPLSKDPYWIYDEQEKECDDNFEILITSKIEDKCKLNLLNFAKEFPINTFGRIDARLRCNDKKLSKEIIKKPLSGESLYFIEINSMPTIEPEDSFEYALNYIMKNPENSFYSCATIYYNKIKKPTINGFLLFCSMASFFKAMY